MAKNIIGRKQEIKIFESIIHSKQAEFVAVYGRRRVGKTFLIKEYFHHKFDFYLTGTASQDTAYQLGNFHDALSTYSSTHYDHPPATWQEAFQRLRAHCEQIEANRKTIIFLDELPWLDTKRSDFVAGLEYFWNSWASAQNNLILIGCGSAASWMINELINNTGGLHNRVTRPIKLLPFTLSETESLLQADHHVLDRYQMLQIYMATGGIPYYLKLLEPYKSAAQNINDLCFGPTAPLRSEFNKLFKSLFSKSSTHQIIVETLSRKSSGMTRQEIVIKGKLKTGGSLTKTMEELEESGFIQVVQPLLNKKRQTIYRLSDFYSLFYLRFIKESNPSDDNFWTNMIDSPAVRAWQGYAFEQVCIQHIPQIKKALGISGIQSTAASWKSKGTKKGAQIDMVIDRRDQVINICEMKYAIAPYRITKTYADTLRNKVGVFKTETKTRKALHLTMLTTFGVERNQYYHTAQQHLDMAILFDQ